MIITIDGPTASGKSTTALALARELGFYYLNSGYLYRALTYLLLFDRYYSHAQLYNPITDDILLYTDPEYLLYCWQHGGVPSIYWKGNEITSLLKAQELDWATPIVSIHEVVQQRIIFLQRVIAHGHDIVVDGRSAGTIAFPAAEYKFYMTASLEVRVYRFIEDKKRRAITIDAQEARKSILLRDQYDTERLIAPLRIAENAIIIDNSILSVQETVLILVSYIRDQKC